jgi:hypothetical protein
MHKEEEEEVALTVEPASALRQNHKSIMQQPCRMTTREREICLTQAMSATKIVRLPAPREDKQAKHNQDTDLTQERASVRSSLGEKEGMSVED